MLLLVISGSLNAQSIRAEATETQQFYFYFKLRQGDDLHKITQLISIDNVRHDTVWAYANTAQYIRFVASGHEVTPLPSPGDAPGIEMSDNFDLGSKTVWNYYPTYTAYESLMTQFQTNYPALCKVSTVTTLTSGRKIMVAKISDNVATDESEPEFLYSSSIHGDETTGYILMLHLIDYLLTNYGTNTEITNLVNSLEIYICPLANPDGTYHGGSTSVSGAWRYNANGIDLNRNYPDPQSGQHPDGNAWQPETIAFMDFATARHFTAGANFHGGAEVVNYPWDTWATLSADDNWWQYISREYADTVHVHAPFGYMTFMENGVTNGFAWYEVDGGRQDYMNYFRNCREVTIEISNTKLLPAAELENHWNYNYRSLILLLKEAIYGVHGIITDGNTGLPVQAQVFIAGHDNLNTQVYSSALNGDYHRPLKAGTYAFTVSATGYQSKVISGIVAADHATTNLNIQLFPAPSDPAVFTATPAGTSQIDLAWTKNAANNDVMVIWSTSATFGVPTGGVAYTTGSVLSGGGTVLYNGSATSFNHTSLNSGTTYYYKIFSKDASNAYSSGLTANATTLCGIFNTLPFSQSFSATTLPSCWTLVDNQGNGQVWQFGTITGQSPNPSLTGNYAYLNSDGYGSGNTQNSDLITPSLNLSNYTAVTLQFSHYFKSYSTSSGKLSYSINNGSTWTQIAAFTTTSVSNPVVFNQLIAAVAGQSQVKFKWNYTGTFAYYWAIDEVQLTGTLVNNLSVTPASQNVTSSSGNTSFSVTSNIAWTASSNAAWCTVTPSGSGNGNITANYTENTSVASRSATITVSATGVTPVTVTVIQAGATPQLTVLPGTISVNDQAGSTSFTVTSNTTWTAVCPETWCSIVPSGTGNGALGVTYNQNPATARSANISVTGAGMTPVIVTLNQAGAEPSNFPSNFSTQNLELHWTDATGAILPSGYLVKMSAVGFSSIAVPVDGVPVANGLTEKNVAYGIQSVTFTNLLPNTTYYFKLYAYTGAGTLIDYKTDGTIPQVQITTTP